MAITLNGDSGILGAINSGTAQNSTSGTSIDFTSIPAGVKRITVMFSGVSGSGSSSFLAQIGSGSVTTSGYQSAVSWGTANTSSTAGFVLSYSLNAGNSYSGALTIYLLSGNNYVSSGLIAQTDSGLYTASSTGKVSLSGALDRVRITFVNGTDTFDAGSINILYE